MKSSRYFLVLGIVALCGTGQATVARAEEQPDRFFFRCRLELDPKMLVPGQADGQTNSDKGGEKENGTNGAKTENGANGAKAENGETPKRPPRTLLQWAVGNGNGNGENGDDEEKPIETDRPDFTEASSTVGRGRIQLEAGYTFTRDREGGSSFREHSYPEMLWRIGLFADWFELRLGQNFVNQRVVQDGVAQSFRGAEDLYLGVKLGLTEQKGVWPETALILQTTVPSGDRQLTMDRVQPGLNYLFGWDIIEGALSAGGSLQANRVLDGTGHDYLEFAQSLTVGYELTRRLGAYTEWFAFYPHGSADPDVGPEHYFDGGFRYLVTNDFQLDVRGGVGLNDHANDYFLGAGFAYRY